MVATILFTYLATKFIHVHFLFLFSIRRRHGCDDFVHLFGNEVYPRPLSFSLQHSAPAWLRRFCSLIWQRSLSTSTFFFSSAFGAGMVATILFTYLATKFIHVHFLFLF